MANSRLTLCWRSVEVHPGPVFRDTIDGPDEGAVVYSRTDHPILIVKNGRTRVVEKPVDHIYVEGRGGDDTFTNNTSLPTLAAGGPGNDTLYGSLGDNVLIGGFGMDVLFVLRDDGSPHALNPGTAIMGDLMIGGTTDYDGNDRALLAILNEWTQSTSRETRMTNLQRGVGPRHAFALNASTVHDDGTMDYCQFMDDDDWLVEWTVLGIVEGAVPPALLHCPGVA